MKDELKGYFLVITHIFLFVLMMLVICPLYGTAQEGQINPGEYITEGGWGHLIVKRDKEGPLTFEIKTVGSNFHECELRGEIQKGEATLETGENAKPCVVSFSGEDDGIDVTPSGDECRHYCGMRAWFKGLYLKPPQGCGQIEVRQTRDEFKRLYDKTAYAEARVKLEPILKVCVNTLNWLEIVSIRNDLAITQYKLHDLKSCRQTLQPLAADAAKTEEELRDEYPPGEAYEYMRILDATRTNLELCNAGQKSSAP